MEEGKTRSFVRDATGLVREIGTLDAFAFNFLSMNVFGIFILGVFAIALYPAANLSLSTALALLPALVIALTYVFLSIAMPRTGGDYVWVGRVIHPVLGFIVNFGLTFVLFTFIAIDVTVFTQWGVGAYFYGIFVNTGDQGALNIFSMLNQTSSPLVFGIGVLLILIVCAIVAFGGKIAFRIQKAVWIFVVFAALAYVVLALYVGPGGFSSSFNRMSGTNMTTVITAAKGAGFNDTVLLSGTLLGFVYVFLNFTGFSFSAYISGEIRNVKRAQFVGIVGSLLVFATFLVVIIQVTEYAFGYDFFHGLAYLFGLQFFGINPQAPYPATLPPAFPEFFVGFLTSNPILIFIITIGCGLSILINAVPYVYVSTRNMLAWAFDRSAPETLSRVDSRLHTPYVALLVTAVFAVIVTYLSVFTSISLLFTYTTFLFAILFAIVGATAILFPYRLRDVFLASPAVVQKRLAGVPIITILGLLTAVLSVYLGYSLFTPDFSGPFVLENFSVVILALLAPAVIYALSYFYYRRKGFDVMKAQKSIPPE